jgi:3-methyladenine DNA glycosylase AlkD
MTFDETMAALKAFGSEQTRKTMLRHGAPATIWGVKVGDMKTLVKKIKVDQGLALKLYATSHPDAQYFAALIADDSTFTKKQLQEWADTSSWHMVGEYSVPWVAAGSPHGWEMGLKWIDAKSPVLQASGWNTLSAVIGHEPDEALDDKAIEKLLARVAKAMPKADGRVKYTMNGFVIAVGCFMEALSPLAMKTAEAIGKIEIDMGDTDCKVPHAPDYIRKVEAAGRIGVKRKMIKC